MRLGSRDNKANVKPVDRTAKTLCLGGIVFVVSCAFIDTVREIPGVSIERLRTKAGDVTSAYFVESRDRLFLKGKVRARFPSKRVLLGHVDIEISSLDGTVTSCGTVRYRNPFRSFKKPFSYWLEVVPEANSIIRVWHHQGGSHSACSEGGA